MVFESCSIQGFAATSFSQPLHSK
jgi:hypothetical protein